MAKTFEPGGATGDDKGKRDAPDESDCPALSTAVPYPTSHVGSAAVAAALLFSGRRSKG